MDRRLLVTALLTVCCACKRRENAAEIQVTAEGGAPAASTSTAVPAEPDPQKIAVRAVLDAGTRAEALAATTPFFERKDDSMGTLLFATWATKNLRWTDVVVARDETSYGMATKDIGEARGKRFCRTGRVDSIRAMAAAGGGKIYVGRFATSEGHYELFAVRNSGAIVAGSVTRVCALVTALRVVDLENGKQVQLVDAVGLFDLPENRAP